MTGWKLYLLDSCKGTRKHENLKFRVKKINVPYNINNYMMFSIYLSYQLYKLYFDNLT